MKEVMELNSELNHTTLDNEDDNVCRTCSYTGRSEYYNVFENSIKFNSSTISLRNVIFDLTQIQVNKKKLSFTTLLHTNKLFSF